MSGPTPLEAPRGPVRPVIRRQVAVATRTRGLVAVPRPPGARRLRQAEEARVTRDVPRHGDEVESTRGRHRVPVGVWPVIGARELGGAVGT